MASKTSSRRRRPASRSNAGSRSRAGSRGTSQRRQARDALNLLKQDHAHVRELFARFERARGEDQKSKLAATICSELKVHAQIEEEIFYPALREALEDEELLDEAQVEHDSAKQLIAQIESGDPGEHLFDAKVKVLGEYVMHHVKEEEGEIFREARSTDLDLAALGEQLKRRKQQLQAREPSAMTRRAAGDAASATV